MTRRLVAPVRPRLEILAELRQQLAPTAPKTHLVERPPVATGLGVVDEALGAGLPRGRLIEIAGTAGRMSLAIGAVAGAAAQGLCTAFIDPGGALDVQALHDSGMDRKRVLWVRALGTPQAYQAADLLVEGGDFGLVVLYHCGAAPPRRLEIWPRLVQHCEKSGCVLLVIGDAPVAGSYAAATLALRTGAAQWQRAPGDRWILVGQELHVDLVRSRLGPPGAQAVARLVRSR